MGRKCDRLHGWWLATEWLRHHLGAVSEQQQQQQRHTTRQTADVSALGMVAKQAYGLALYIALSGVLVLLLSTEWPAHVPKRMQQQSTSTLYK